MNRWNMYIFGSIHLLMALELSANQQPSQSQLRAMTQGFRDNTHAFNHYAGFSAIAQNREVTVRGRQANRLPSQQDEYISVAFFDGPLHPILAIPDLLSTLAQANIRIVARGSGTVRGMTTVPFSQWQAQGQGHRIVGVGRVNASDIYEEKPVLMNQNNPYGIQFYIDWEHIYQKQRRTKSWVVANLIPLF